MLHCSLSRPSTKLLVDHGAMMTLAHRSKNDWKKTTLSYQKHVSIPYLTISHKTYIEEVAHYLRASHPLDHGEVHSVYVSDILRSQIICKSKLTAAMKVANCWLILAICSWRRRYTILSERYAKTPEKLFLQSPELAAELAHSEHSAAAAGPTIQLLVKRFH